MSTDLVQEITPEIKVVQVDLGKGPAGFVVAADEVEKEVIAEGAK